MRYLRPSIHSVSACEPRPSAASTAALYPRNAWSLDMEPLVRGFSSRSARKPATASENLPMSTQMSARCFAQVSCSSRLFKDLASRQERLLHKVAGTLLAPRHPGHAYRAFVGGGYGPDAGPCEKSQDARRAIIAASPTVFQL
jgi:hypothetical protein